MTEPHEMTEALLVRMLAHRGWISFPIGLGRESAVPGELARLGKLLGDRIAGRGGAMEDVVRPRSAHDAHPRSLSARFGFGALPLHAELSHRPRPCRYLLLGCLEPGSPAAVTLLLEWRRLGLSDEELRLLASAAILVRSGRRSFYSTLLGPGATFLRYDPACMEAVDERGKKAMGLVERRLATSRAEAHEWHRGDILVVDNWRVLHGRGRTEEDSGRRLARILIDAR